MPQPVAFSALIGVEFDITALKLPTDNKISPAKVIFICERKRRRTNIDPFDDDWPRFFWPRPRWMASTQASRIISRICFKLDKICLSWKKKKKEKEWDRERERETREWRDVRNACLNRIYDQVKNIQKLAAPREELLLSLSFCLRAGNVIIGEQISHFDRMTEFYCFLRNTKSFKTHSLICVVPYFKRKDQGPK